jgi:hypothetical protein
MCRWPADMAAVKIHKTGKKSGESGQTSAQESVGEKPASEKYVVEDHFDGICAILAELWNDYREEEEWAQFAEENDIGLFLAYMMQEGYVRGDGLTSAAKAHISDTWDVLCYTIDANPDVAYDNIEDLFDQSRLNPLTL